MAGRISFSTTVVASLFDYTQSGNQPGETAADDDRTEGITEERTARPRLACKLQRSHRVLNSARAA